MEDVRIFETSIYLYETTRRCILEGCLLYDKSLLLYSDIYILCYIPICVCTMNWFNEVISFDFNCMSCSALLHPCLQPLNNFPYLKRSPQYINVTELKLRA
jgi:hypothetical protein